MKKLLIAAFVILMLFGSTAWSAQRLKGKVMFASDSTGVGPGKPVYVYFSPDSFETVYTRAAPDDSWYCWSFYPPKYFYKVRCRFTQGQWIYEGQTIIDATLSGDGTYHIYVYKTLSTIKID